MHRYRPLILILSAAFVGTAAAADAPCFVPGQDCAAAVVAEIGKARRSILVQGYGFTNPAIAQALVTAHKARPDMEITAVLDHDVNQPGQHSLAPDLVAAGVAVLLDDKHAIAHNKVSVIDGATVITGSFNFTVAAETRNAENLVVIRSRAVAVLYERNFRSHQAHSAPYPQMADPPAVQSRRPAELERRELDEE